jgi:hypothetical protein
MDQKTVILVFDFDNTLFDTEELKRTMYRAAIECGLTPVEAREVYNRARGGVSGKITISIDSFFKELSAHIRTTGEEFDEKKTVMLKQWLVDHGSELVFAGVDDFLLKVTKRFSCYLISLGVPTWQQEKINLSGLVKYFSEDKMVLTDDVDTGKHAVLTKLFGKDTGRSNIILFNDKPDESEDLLNNFPNIMMYIRRDMRDERYLDEAIWQRLREKYAGRVMMSSDITELFMDFLEKNVV